ncbi:MAG: hypothetical protein ACYC4S_04520 [Rhodoferax sp.]
MVGAGLPNSRIKKFENAISDDRLLMMLDVSSLRVHEIEALITHHHAEAELEGVDPIIPIFP